MADSAVAVTAGAGTNIDTRTEGSNGNHRQVVVLGDPATNAGVAPVDGTAGLKVDLGADNDVVASLAAGSNNIGDVDIASIPMASTATLSNVAGSASSVTLKALNANRRALIVVNDSSVAAYVKYGATASATDFTYKLGPGEVLREQMYTGVVDAIWESATGSARVTELTA